MKKFFPFAVPGKEPLRVVEAIKQDVRKYLKRERRKALPEGVDFWDFDCKVGRNQEPPAIRHPAELIDAIDTVALSQAETVYVEILAKPGVRVRKETPKAEPRVEENPDRDSRPSSPRRDDRKST